MSTDPSSYPDTTTDTDETSPERAGQAAPEAIGGALSGPPSALASPVLENATRSIGKATLVPLAIQVAASGQAVIKSGFLSQLELRPGEADMARERATAGGVDELVSLFGDTGAGGGPVDLPQPGALADIPVDSLRLFGNTVADLRREAADEPTGDRLVLAAVSAVTGLEINTAVNPLGMLNLERLEMTPAGIERGELIATIPLAPLEETAVIEKEWSVQSKEFSSIVTDELEQFSETGVTDNTELAQSVNSQQQHSNQFNITGTVSGGIPLISGSASSAFTSQDTNSLSATDSRKQATTLTQKASARSRQEHKVTITTKSVVGSEETTSRKLRNPSDQRAIRIDYFSLMRKWRVRLYRYGLRLTYDIVVPEPGAAMRKTYQELAALQAQLGPFEFTVLHNDITDDVRQSDPAPPVTDPPTPRQPHYRVLADQYGATVPDPPPAVRPQWKRIEQAKVGSGWRFHPFTFRVEDGYRIKELAVHFQLGQDDDEHTIHYGVMGTDLHLRSDDPVPDTRHVLTTRPGTPYLGSTGEQTIVFFLQDVEVGTVGVDYVAERTPERYAQWQSEVWNALYTAAQTKYYGEQQYIASKIADIEERLSKVDTLTMRREESDEVMKSVIRFIAGEAYQYMNDTTVAAFNKASEDAVHGIGFRANKLTFEPGQFAAVTQHENVVRFINQAIEWENVVTFLYSYFWDNPVSWEFIRQIQHPDANRQAFMRAGSARVVLTVRKGWEVLWLRFAESGFTNPQFEPDAAYLNIAREIAAYDDRNYPGIPPANSGRNAIRLADSVYTISSVSIAASQNPVTIKVDSVAGFVPGARVVIGAADEQGTQESQLLQAVVVPDKLVVQRLKNPHDGTATPFPVVLPGEKGALIAEWSEYTPSSGTDIAVTSNLSEIA